MVESLQYYLLSLGVFYLKNLVEGNYFEVLRIGQGCILEYLVFEVKNAITQVVLGVRENIDHYGVRHFLHVSLNDLLLYAMLKAKATLTVCLSFLKLF